MKLGQWTWRRFFLISSIFFSLFHNYFPLEKGRPPHLNNTQGCFVPSLVEIGLVVLEKIFFNFVNVFSLFLNFLLLEKGRALHLNKIESPSPKDDLCQVWLKLAKWFWRKRFLNLVNVFSNFRNYLPLEKGGALQLDKIESLSPEDALCQVWLKLGQWFWRRFSLISSMFFCFFIIISPWKRAGSFI